MLIFNLAGAFNAVLGLYVLLEGRAFLPGGTALVLALFFFGFAAVDFWFPYAIKKKWLEERARQAAQQAKDESGRMKDEGEKA